MRGFELVDWTPARFGPITCPEHWSRWRRRHEAFRCNMRVRPAGKTYIHNGRKPSAGAGK